MASIEEGRKGNKHSQHIVPVVIQIEGVAVDCISKAVRASCRYSGVKKINLQILSKTALAGRETDCVFVNVYFVSNRFL